MTRLVTLGGETDEQTNAAGGPEQPGPTTGNVLRATNITAAIRSGTGYLVCTDTTGSQASFFTLIAGPALGASTTIYVRAYIRLNLLPSATVNQILALPSVISVRVTTAGNLQLWNETGTPAQIGSGAAIAVNTYYRVELQLTTNASSQITTVALRLDGAAVASASGLALAVGSAALNVGLCTTPAHAGVALYVDDVAVNNSSGAVNNSWPGDGHVVALYPTADSAVGTGWTLGTGTAIAANGWSAINNPIVQGLVDLQAASDTHQIRNATSNANVNYDATMTTYSAAGVPAGATINAVIPWVVTAAPVVTSAKAGTVGVVSNPTIANVALSAGGTAGAFWSGVAASSFPTGWKWSAGTTVEAPTVTLGTAPVMRITQVTASTRIAMVCGMFMYVDYSPAAAAQIPDVGMALTVT